MKLRFVAIAAFFLCAHGLSAQSGATVSIEELQQRLATEKADVHIVNFWATWCGPCVKELPMLEEVTARDLPGVKVTLVSLDLDLNPDTARVLRFVRQRGIKSEVLLLDEPDPNGWIGKIDVTWSGALPATLILNRKTGERTFIERALRDGELQTYFDVTAE